MAKCPNCGEYIDHLKAYSQAYQLYDGCEYGVYIGLDCSQVDYECPVCGEILFDHEDDAREFLNP